MCGKITVTDDMPYQLLHRVASACYAAMQDGKKKSAVVIYHLFYSNQEEHDKATDFAKDLKDSVRKMFGQFVDGELPISFHVILTEVKFPPKGSRAETCLNSILARSRKERKFYSELFVLMQEVNVYSFESKKIERYRSTD